MIIDFKAEKEKRAKLKLEKELARYRSSLQKIDDVLEALSKEIKESDTSSIAFGNYD